MYKTCRWSSKNRTKPRVFRTCIGKTSILGRFADAKRFRPVERKDLKIGKVIYCRLVPFPGPEEGECLEKGKLLLRLLVLWVRKRRVYFDKGKGFMPRSQAIRAIVEKRHTIRSKAPRLLTTLFLVRNA